MFDIGFFELFVVIIIGLFVVGPERLPGTIKTCALWIDRIRHTLRETREDFERHIGADEIRRELHNEQVMRSLEALKSTKKELVATVNSPENSILGAQEDQDLPDTYPHDENGLAITAPQATPEPQKEDQESQNTDTDTTKIENATNTELNAPIK